MTDIQARIDTEIAAVFDKLKHGDAEHQAWLKSNIEDAVKGLVSIIKELKFELDEAQTDAEIWKNTDFSSQAEIKELQAQLSAKGAIIAELQKENEWRDIASVPKDGAKIEVWHKLHKCVISVYWLNDKRYNPERYWITSDKNQSWPEECFTHWRLPEPPKGI